MRKFWNWLILSLGIHDLRFKQTATQEHCDILESRLIILEKLVSVGADIHRKSDSWIVLSIAGKPEYVGFYRLPQEEIKHIAFLLRGLEKQYGSVNKDIPSFAREYFGWRSIK